VNLQMWLAQPRQHI